MSLDENLSRYIGRIYEAAHDAAEWELVVDELLARTNSRLALVASVDTSTGEYHRNSFHGAIGGRALDGIQQYAEEWHHCDPTLDFVRQNPVARFGSSREFVDGDYLGDQFVRWNQDHFNSTDWVVGFTPVEDHLTFGISIHARATGPHSRSDLALFRMLFGHFERAVRLAARPPDLGSQAQAVFVLDTTGRKLALSPRAEVILSDDDGLMFDQGILSGADAAATGELHAALRAVLQGGSGGCVRLARPSGKPDWLVMISPYPRRLEHLQLSTIPAIVLRIVEPAEPILLLPRICGLFDLTMREFEVAQALLEGHSPDSLARHLGISSNTARVHVKALFRKTGTNRQSELMRLLTTLAR